MIGGGQFLYHWHKTDSLTGFDYRLQINATTWNRIITWDDITSTK